MGCTSSKAGNKFKIFKIDSITKCTYKTKKLLMISWNYSKKCMLIWQSAAEITSWLNKSLMSSFIPVGW